MFTRRAIGPIAAAAIAIIWEPGAARAQGQLNVICAPAAQWCEAIVAGFTKETGIKVNMVRKSAGEILAQVRAEAKNPKLDLWFGASAETHMVAAESGLLQPYSSANMANLHAWALKPHQQSKGHCVGVSSAVIGLAYNPELLKKKGVAPPKEWDDLLAPQFKGEVQMPNPNSSGTAYTIIAGLVQLWGEDKAFDYLKKLHANINTYQRIGEAPVNAVSRGETSAAIGFDLGVFTDKYAGFPVEINYPASGTSYEVACMSLIKGARNEKEAKRFYDWYLTGPAQDIGPNVNQWHQPSFKFEKPNPKLPDTAAVKRVDYDFATYGQASTRKRLLDRWEREVGSLPR